MNSTELKIIAWYHRQLENLADDTREKNFSHAWIIIQRIDAFVMDLAVSIGLNFAFVHNLNELGCEYHG